jgi:hypothetical protein
MMKSLIAFWLVLYGGPALCAEGPKCDIFCQLKAKDEFGDAQARYCSMSYSDFSRDYPVGKRPIDYGTFFVMDGEGIKFTGGNPPTVQGCQPVAFRFAVDGKLIDRLNNSAQIEAVLTGEKFTREEQQPFPNCVALPHSMALDGLSENFQHLKRSWVEANPPVAKLKN